MSSFKVLVVRDFKSRVKGGSFIVTTILGMLVFVGIAFAPALMSFIERSTQSADVNILVLDRTGGMLETIRSTAEELRSDDTRIAVTDIADAVPALSSSVPGLSDKPAADWTEADASEVLRNGDYAGVLILEQSAPGAYGQFDFTFLAKNATSLSQNRVMQDLSNRVVTRTVAARMGLSSADIASLTAPAALKVKQVEMEAGSEGKEISSDQYMQSMVLTYFLLFMLYMALIMYGNMVASGVAEEKASRIMEVMISKVRPFELMASKIVGIGSLGLAQFLVWVGTALAVIGIQNTGVLGDAVKTGFEVTSLPIDTILWFGIFFVLGFFLFATVFAAAGASVSRVEDVNQASTLITLLLAVGFMMGYVAFANPNSGFAVACSLVPFLSPMVMFSRVALADPPIIQVAASLLLLVAACLGSLWVTSRIYRAGVLNYGKKPRLREVIGYVFSND